MNYLAHAFLSGENEELLVGNFIADHLRGNNFSAYSAGIIEGIKMHREIDSFTDTHPLFRASKRIFYKDFEKYSGILVDIYFDHLLAKQFSNFHRQSLEEFSSNTYKVYLQHEHLMPEGSSRFLKFVLQNNIYQNYSTLEGITTVLWHLSRRIGHQVNLADSVYQFSDYEEIMVSYFSKFIVDLKSNLKDKK